MAVSKIVLLLARKGQEILERRKKTLGLCGDCRYYDFGSQGCVMRSCIYSSGYGSGPVDRDYNPAIAAPVLPPSDEGKEKTVYVKEMDPRHLKEPERPSAPPYYVASQRRIGGYISVESGGRTKNLFDIVGMGEDEREKQIVLAWNRYMAQKKRELNDLRDRDLDRRAMLAVLKACGIEVNEVDTAPDIETEPAVTCESNPGDEEGEPTLYEGAVESLASAGHPEAGERMANRHKW